MTKHDQGKPDFTLVPQKGLRAVAEVMTYGAIKYGRDNWRKRDGDGDVNRLLAGASRHMNSHLIGELRDESTMLHLAHLAAGALMALELEIDKQSAIDSEDEFPSGADIERFSSLLTNGLRPKGFDDAD